MPNSTIEEEPIEDVLVNWDTIRNGDKIYHITPDYRRTKYLIYIGRVIGPKDGGDIVLEDPSYHHLIGRWFSKGKWYNYQEKKSIDSKEKIDKFLSWGAGHRASKYLVLGAK